MAQVGSFGSGNGFKSGIGSCGSLKKAHIRAAQTADHISDPKPIVCRKGWVKEISVIFHCIESCV
jgi:hypothetical protein